MELNLHPNEASGPLTMGDGEQTVATHVRCILLQDAHSGSEFVCEFPSLPASKG
jgi:hypothetical protein